MAIRAVTFDVWLTLIWDDEEVNEYWKLRRLINFHRLVKRLPGDGPSSKAAGFNTIRLASEELGKRAKEIYARGRDISPMERGQMLFEILGIKIAEAESRQAYERAGRILSNSGYSARQPNLNPEAKAALRGLKKRFPRVRVGLVSNAARSSDAYETLLRRYGIATYFDSLTISSEVGFLKPRKEIFDAALRSLSVKPTEALHVGDSFSMDVVGATSVGMNAALYTGLWHRYAPHHGLKEERIPKDFRPTPPA